MGLSANDLSVSGHCGVGSPRPKPHRRLRTLIAVCAMGCLLFALSVMAVLLFVDPQSSRRAYILRYYTLPRYLGAWVRPEMPPKYSGVWRDWHEDGSRYLEESLVAGVRDGRHTKFGAFDGREEEGSYVNGLRAGKWTWYEPGDRVVAEGVYINGREWEGMFKMRCLNDKFCNLIVSYTRGERNGPYVVQNLGYTLEEGRFIHGRLDGQQTLWWNYEARIRASEGGFVEGRRDGWWTWWSARGDLIARGEYREGKKWDGAFVEWDTDKLGFHPYRGGGHYRVRRFAGGTEVPGEGRGHLHGTEP